jgi:hypothetical protein
LAKATLNIINSLFAKVLLVFEGIFQKFAIWDATRVACGGG